MGAVIKLASGATEADITKALAQLKDGGTLVLPKNEVIQISSGLKIDVSNRDITFDLNGSTLQQAGNTMVIFAYGSHVPQESVKLSTTTGGDTVITYSKAQAGLKVGDWVKVFSDDKLPNGYLTGDEPTRLGQALQVKAIDGGTVTLGGTLVYQDKYLTNVRASEYLSGDLKIMNGTVQGDQSKAGWKTDLVQVRTAVDPVVERLTVQNGNSMGINVVDSVNAMVKDAVVRNLLDNTANGNFGYGVHSSTSTGTTVVGLYADKVRHATDNNSMGVTAGHGNASKYGADIGMTVTDSIAYNLTSFAWDWHTEGLNGRTSDVMAFNSYGFGGVRGIGNSITDSAGYGLVKGIQFNEYGDGDARDNTFDNITLRSVRDYAYSTLRSPKDNLITNSTFEVLYGATNFNGGGRTENVNIIRGKLVPDDFMTGTAASDKLLGGEGADIIRGMAGDDYIWGGDGIDILTGGAGRDRFAYHSVSEAGDTIVDFDAKSDILDVSIMAAQNNWKGDALANGYVRIAQDGTSALLQVDANGGGDGFVTLARLLNVDARDVTAANIQTLISGVATTTLPDEAIDAPPSESDSGGSDTATWEAAGTVWTTLDAFTLSETSKSKDLAHASDSPFTATGNSRANAITGSKGNDRLTGLGGDDSLDGGAGADTLIGGVGNDGYFVDNVGDVVTELAGEGIDTITTSLSSYTLGANVENLAFAGFDAHGKIGAFTGTGNELANLLMGGDGNDRLDGKVGADTMIGGLGNDTYVVDNVGDVVVEVANGGTDRVQASVSYTLSDNVESLQLGTSQSINGTGNSQNNTLTGTAGANILDGKAGADTMIGGLGNDTYVVDDAGDIVTELAGQGTDTVLTDLASYALGSNVENLTYTGSGNFSGVGNELANLLTGGNRSDRLDGGTGADTMVGGLGNDTYIVDNVGDVVVEKSGEGTDRVLATISYTLADNVRLLQFGTSASLDGTGNVLDNQLVGNKGNNVLDGRGGADTLTGGAGNDTFVFRAGEAKGDVVTDFTGAGRAAGDQLKFVGYGKNASLTQVGRSDFYTVHADPLLGGFSETIQIAGVTNLDVISGAGHNDVIFA
ncbi:calcium-binding protein [uncultured Methylobacterium sp.]|jgi:Ca2+-binding RTX toxin-like protein|uniref:calcium-binding protein n=1 Tax=uncultured Methylobacterium sp. TaxID=157278 RepID=UPI00261BB93D|nr:calcium-binding protein [uncultured Methylobacterium sp.]